jgi:hypothetical protein
LSVQRARPEAGEESCAAAPPGRVQGSPSLAVAALIALAGMAASCSRRSEATEAAHPATDRLASILAWENATRAQTDFTNVPTAGTALGPDPYVIRRLVEPPAAGAPHARASDPQPPAFVGILRGRSALVSLDDSLHETARLPAPDSPTGLALAPNGEVLVVGELARRIARYRVEHGVLRPAGAVDLPDVRAMRDVAAGPEGVVYVVEEHDGRLIALRPAAPGAHGGAADLPPAEREDTALCHGPVHVSRVARSVLVDCLLDHAVVVRPVDARGFPTAAGEARVVHDGPMWGMAALEDGDGLLLAVGGVEDHPLDRTQGSFGFVDSFVTIYRLAGGVATKLVETNTSALGVVTPKALALSRRGASAGGFALTVAAYGSDRMVTLRFDPDAADLERHSLAAAGERDGRGSRRRRPRPRESAPRRLGPRRRRRCRRRAGGRRRVPPTLDREPAGRSALFHHAHGALELVRGPPEPVHLRDLPFRGVRRRSDAPHGPRRRPRHHQATARSLQQSTALLASARSRSDHDGQ